MAISAASVFRVDDRSTKDTPSGYSGDASSAARIANVVFPVPPGPTRVRRRIE